MANTPSVVKSVNKALRIAKSSNAIKGTTWYVSSVDGNTLYSGVDPLLPKATLEQAVALAVAGDTIVLLENHAQVISASTTISLAGLKVIARGYAGQRATFTLDTAATTRFNITGANVRFENCVFVANVAGITACFKQNANGLTLVDCEFRDTSAILNFTTLVLTSSTTNLSDGLIMLRCKYFGLSADTGTTIISVLGMTNRMLVEDCYFAHANVDDGGLFMLITSTKVLTNLEVKSSRFNFKGVSSAAAGVLITTDVSTNSGYFANCYVKHLDATSEIMVTASSGFVFWDLKATAVADKNAYLVPAADS